MGHYLERYPHPHILKTAILGTEHEGNDLQIQPRDLFLHAGARSFENMAGYVPLNHDPSQETKHSAKEEALKETLSSWSFFQTCTTKELSNPEYKKYLRIEFDRLYKQLLDLADRLFLLELLQPMQFGDSIEKAILENKIGEWKQLELLTLTANHTVATNPFGAFSGFITAISEKMEETWEKTAEKTYQLFYYLLCMCDFFAVTKKQQSKLRSFKANMLKRQIDKRKRFFRFMGEVITITNQPEKLYEVAYFYTPCSADVSLKYALIHLKNVAGIPIDVNTVLVGKNIQYLNCLEKDFHEMDLSHSDMENVNARGANFVASKIFSSNLRRAFLSNAILSRASFIESDLSGAFLDITLPNKPVPLFNPVYGFIEKSTDVWDTVVSLQKTICVRTVFNNRAMYNWNFRGADLTEAQMYDVLMEEVNFKGANLKGLKLSFRNDSSTVIVDKETTLPDGSQCQHIGWQFARTVFDL